MKRLATGLLTLFLLVHVPLCAELVGLNIEGRTTGRVGYTNYELRDTDEFGNTVYSLLEFPLNTYYIGGFANLRFGAANKREFEVMLGMAMNLNDPRNVMKDSDWFEPAGTPKLKFSYTESPVQLTAFEITLEGRMRIFPHAVKSLYVTGGYRFLRYSEDVFGYAGWYVDIFDPPPPPPYEVVDGAYSTDELVLDYYINFHTPYLGVLWYSSGSPHFLFEIGADLALAIVNDYDDHILRGKVMTAFGLGVGIHTFCGISFFPVKQDRKYNPYIRLVAAANYLAANTKQTQKWYKDEGTTTAGTVISGIVHDIRSLQVGAEVTMGMRIKL